MTAWERQMQGALLDAADVFSRYADHHLAKEPPDREKAQRNVECAAVCREAATELKPGFGTLTRVVREGQVDE